MPPSALLSDVNSYTEQRACWIILWGQSGVDMAQRTTAGGDWAEDFDVFPPRLGLYELCVSIVGQIRADPSIGMEGVARVNAIRSN